MYGIFYQSGDTFFCFYHYFVKESKCQVNGEMSPSIVERNSNATERGIT